MTADLSYDRPTGVEHQLAAAFAALLPALFAMWAARHALAILWPAPAAVDLAQWVWTTVQRYGAEAERHEQWFRLQEMGYQYYLVVVAACGLLVWTAVFAFATGRGIGATTAYGTIGFAMGAGAGLSLPFATPVGAMAAVLLGPLLAFALGTLAAATAERRPVDVRPRRGARVRHGLEHAAAQRGGITIAKVALPAAAETRHAVLLGATGTGKSTVMREMMRGAFARGDTAIVADPDGTSMASLRQDGDLVLNPQETGSVRWDLSGELAKEADYRLMAEALAPHTGSVEDRRWVEAARLVLSAALASWHRSGSTALHELGAVLASADPQALGAICEGTPAARFFAEGNERFLGSVLSALATPTDTLVQSAALDGPAFSVRRWVRTEATRQVEGRRGRRLWLPYSATQLPLLRNALSTWLSIAMAEVLALPESQTRRMWFFIDEADQLGRINELELLMTKGRKKGACVVLGFQSIAQLQHHYDALIADVINEQCGTRLILRCDTSRDGGTAKFASDLIGEREVMTPEETTSHSRGRNPSTSVSSALRRHMEKAVLPSEIAQLPDCEGYLRIAREAHWRHVRFDPEDRSVRHGRRS